MEEIKGGAILAHKHNIYDTDNHYTISAVDRSITNVSPTKVLVMQYDHNSERLTFELPRYIEEHDMSLCNSVQVHFINTDGKNTHSDVYEVKDLQVSPDGENVVICSWLISQNATQYAGSLGFLVRFACIGDDGVIEYAWNTDIYKNLSVQSGIYNSEIIVEQYADILEQWKEELFSAAGGSGGTAEVTAESIENALGYTPADDADVTKLSTAIVEQGKTIPKVFQWANAELPFTENEISGVASGGGFVVNPTNFADGKTYFRYHAGASYGFLWTNPNQQKGAVTLTVLSWNQYDKESTGNSSSMYFIYADGTQEIIRPQNGVVGKFVSNADKTLAQIKGNYDIENWILLDMDVLSIVADYPEPAGSAEVTAESIENALGYTPADDADVAELSSAISDKATLENGVIKFWKSAEVEGGADTELFAIDISTVGGSGGLDLSKITLSVSQVGEYQRLSMSDGTTTKTVDIPITAISDEQVQTAVQAWLDEHPEATTTVADGSITEPKLADGAVTEKKTVFLDYDEATVNLLDTSKCTAGYKIAYWGVISEDEAYSVTDFIPVKENTVYTRNEATYNASCYTVFFDETKTRLPSPDMYVAHQNRLQLTYTTPAGCAYVRFDVPTANISEVMLVEGDTPPTEYIPYGAYYKLGKMVRVGSENIKDLAEFFGNIPQKTINSEMLADDVWGQIDTVVDINTKINIAEAWKNPYQTTETLSGRINMFEHVEKGVFSISGDISRKTIVVHGVNYFNVDDMVDTASNIKVSNHAIPVQPGKRLYFNRNNNADNSYIIVKCYDENDVFLRNIIVGGNYKAYYFEPESDVYFIRIHLGDYKDIYAEQLCIADVDIGNTIYGYGSSSAIVSGNTVYFGKTMYFPYVGYRIENGVLVGASDTYTVEELMHVDVLEAAETIEVTAPVEEKFDTELLKNVNLTFGRFADTDYVIARVYKTRVDGGEIRPKVVAISGGESPSNYTAGNDFILAVTGGIFDTNTNIAYGNLISNGEIIGDHVACPTLDNLGDTLAIDKSGNFVSYAYETDLATMLADGVTGALNGWATIVFDYTAVDIPSLSEHLGSTVHESKHPRAAVGQFRGGDYMVFICGGRTTHDAGMTGAEMQELFLSLGVKYAYNLDGGGSCTLRYYKKELAPYTENRVQPAYIVFG